MHRWRIQNVVLWKLKQKEWRGNHFEKGACGQGSGIVERTDRIICLKMELDGVMLNVISAYAPQVGCIREEKEVLWMDLDETVEKIPKNKKIVVGADLNRHVGGNNSDKECIGRHGLGKRNNEGQAVVNFAKRMKLAITNTYFVNKSVHRVTYNSGGRSSQVDYIMMRRR